jgi:hypothetical protein
MKQVKIEEKVTTFVQYLDHERGRVRSNMLDKGYKDCSSKEATHKAVFVGTGTGNKSGRIQKTDHYCK